MRGLQMTKLVGVIQTFSVPYACACLATSKWAIKWVLVKTMMLPTASASFVLQKNACLHEKQHRDVMQPMGLSVEPECGD